MPAMLEAALTGLVLLVAGVWLAVSANDIIPEMEALDGPGSGVIDLGAIEHTLLLVGVGSTILGSILFIGVMATWWVLRERRKPAVSDADEAPADAPDA